MRRVLDRQDKLHLDIARRTKHDHIELADPTDTLGKLDTVEKQATFAFLSELPPKVFGGR